MLYVAIWYVSIRYEGEGRTAVAQHVSDFSSTSSGAFLCCMLQFGMSRYVMRVKEELSSSFTLITTGRIETYQTATHSIRKFLKMDY